MAVNLFNAITIIVGGILGKFLGQAFSQNLSKLLLRTMGLVVIYIGISSFSQEVDLLIIIFSLLIGGIIGYLLKLERFFDKLANWISSHIFKTKDDNSFKDAFINATVLFAAGSMGVMGGIEAGSFGNIEILLAKSIIDGVSACALSASQGIGVAFAALPVFIYQSIFVLFGKAIQPLMTLSLQAEMSVVGGIIIMAIGINMLFDHDLPISNYIPSIFLPLIFSLFI